MSQYPHSPYTTPYVYPTGYGYDPYGAYLAPARRAGILMFVLGGLGIVCGVCMGLFGTLASMAPILAQGGIDLQRLEETGMSPETLLRTMFVVVAALSLLVSVIILALAPFVRRGSIGAIITAIVISCIGGLFLLINALSGISQVLRAPNGPTISGFFFVLLMLGTCVMLIVWLFKAVRGASAMKTAQAQYQMQYWQYQQQMQAQQSGGYQYPPPPPPAAGN